MGGGGVSQGGIHLQKVGGKNTFRIYDDIVLNCLCIINSKRNTTLSTVTEKLPSRVCTFLVKQLKLSMPHPLQTTFYVLCLCSHIIKTSIDPESL